MAQNISRPYCKIKAATYSNENVRFCVVKKDSTGLRRSKIQKIRNITQTGDVSFYTFLYNDNQR
jgi:hypothetical protein